MKKARLAKCFSNLCLVFVLGTITACTGSSGSSDVTADSKYWGGYKLGGQYALQQDLFAISINGGPIELYAPEEQTYSESATGEKYTVPSLQEYRDAPGKRPYVIGLLPKGMQIRVIKFELHSSFENTDLHIQAQPVEGQFKNKDVDIQALSISAGNGLALSPNPDDLK